MMRNLLVLAVAALALAGVALATPAGTPGVTSTTITIGSSGPLTGEAAAAAGVLKGADGYFKYVNAKGGVNGRTIDFKYLDDAYDPSQTVQNVRELIEQDNVFALFSVVGTNENLAIRDYVNAAGVPQVFSAAGATTLNYGVFVNNVVSFLIIDFCAFLIVRSVNKFVHAHDTPPVLKTKSCPFCAMEIPLAATRCPNCTSQLTGAAAA